jgi:hypothetical protein
MIKYKVVKRDIGKIGSEQNQGQHYRAIAQQQAARNYFNTLNKIDVTTGYHDLHEGMKRGYRYKTKESIETQNNKYESQQHSGYANCVLHLNPFSQDRRLVDQFR